MSDMCYHLGIEQRRSLAATPRLLDVFLDLLKAYESAGPVGASVTALYTGIAALFEMHEALFEFSQINRTAVRGAASGIRYVLDHPLVWDKANGWSTTQGAVRTTVCLLTCHVSNRLLGTGSASRGSVWAR